MGVDNILTFDAHDPRVQNAIPLKGFETIQQIRRRGWKTPIIIVSDRKDDIEPLVRHYWRNMTGRMATKKQIAALMNYDYPGNVRELISLLKQAKALGEDDFAKILAAHESFNKKLIDGLRQRREGIAPVEEYPDNQEELLCRHAVNICKKYDQNLTKASEAADISPNTLKKYLRLAKARGIS